MSELDEIREAWDDENSLRWEEVKDATDDIGTLLVILDAMEKENARLQYQNQRLHGRELVKEEL